MDNGGTAADNQASLDNQDLEDNNKIKMEIIT